MPQNEGRVEEFMPSNEGFQLTREESKALAGALLDVMGLPEPDLDDEEREVIRRAVREWRRRKMNEGK